MMTRLWDLLWKHWYPALTRLTTNANVVFLNYGYSFDGSEGSGPKLEAQDEADRTCIQLYHHVVSLIDVQGMNILEVSCGHGGGASYVARYLKPQSVHGVDRNPRAIELCQRLHRVDGLTFSCGNALALDFAESRFDVVLNIEASHCYPDMPRFFHEVKRVLRPGGYLLYADFRRNGRDRVVLQRQVAEAGLEIVKSEDISAGVVLGMQRNNDRYRALIDNLVVKLLRKPAIHFAGVKGSPIYNRLKSGETVYLLYALRKPVTARG